MKKQIFTLLTMCVCLVFISCSDDDKNEDQTNYKDIEIVVERTSNGIDAFFGGDIITIVSDKDNTVYDASDFDQVLENDGKKLLSKVLDSFTSSNTYKIKQKNVNVQFLETPQIKDDVSEEVAENLNLVTKIKIFVDKELVKEQTFNFSLEGANIQMVTYSK